MKKRDLTLTLTNGASDTDTLVDVLRRGLADYLDLLLQIKVCEEKQLVPSSLAEGRYALIGDFKFYIEELANGLERHKSSELLTTKISRK